MSSVNEARPAVESAAPEENLFDLSQEYDAMLNQGIRLSGEGKQFFLEGRVRDLEKRLSAMGSRPRAILDFGCGIGDSTAYLAERFPEASVVGVDTAVKALEYAAEKNASPRISYRPLSEFTDTAAFDLCYVNGVFHHIRPEERPDVVRRIHRSLKPGGHFALFENNPWNPGTRMVMSRIPFDHDAQTLPPPETQKLLREAGFSLRTTRFLFYFPRSLAFLRFSEPALARLPLGAQYYVLGVKG